MKTIAIIGAGLGGLAAAVLLAAAGNKVDVYETHSYPGGKMKRYHVGGARFDFGPNTITMPQVFQSVFERSGADPNDYVKFEQIVDHTNNIFPDGSQFLASSNRAKMLQELERFNIHSSDYDRYITAVTQLYNHSANQFFTRSFSSLKEYTSLRLALAFASVKPFTKMSQFHSSFFKDERIVQMLNRYATYIGSSPYKTPATFSMIGYLEFVQGVYYVKGGNPTIAEAMHRRAKELGVQFYFNKTVKKLKTANNEVTSLVCANNQEKSYDQFILNGDYTTVYPKLVEKQNRPSFTLDQLVKEPTSSAFVILAATSQKTAASFHHQVYFSQSYEYEFYQLFDEKKYPDDPTIYICNSSVNDDSAVSHTGGDNLFILVNAPSLTNENRTLDKEQMKEKVYSILEQRGVLIRPYLIEDKVVSPKDIEARISAYFGGLYGFSSHTTMQAFNRPSSKTKDFQNLYFAGGSTHQGVARQWLCRAELTWRI
ncbi:LOW QUALITY PROTEIN: phytoene desaturase, neurosporene or lycopene producing [Bacillus sp. JCM 19046]|nr:LOW QUALITY PROTEIN: phytoene desaturase, neurosporene or lycopene producing [Bacillus sp. JCM 19046]